MPDFQMNPERVSFFQRGPCIRFRASGLWFRVVGCFGPDQNLLYMILSYPVRLGTMKWLWNFNIPGCQRQQIRTADENSVTGHAAWCRCHWNQDVRSSRAQGLNETSCCTWRRSTYSLEHCGCNQCMWVYIADTRSESCTISCNSMSPSLTHLCLAPVR